MLARVQRISWSRRALAGGGRDGVGRSRRKEGHSGEAHRGGAAVRAGAQFPRHKKEGKSLPGSGAADLESRQFKASLALSLCRRLPDWSGADVTSGRGPFPLVLSTLPDRSSRPHLSRTGGQNPRREPPLPAGKHRGSRNRNPPPQTACAASAAWILEAAVSLQREPLRAPLQHSACHDRLDFLNHKTLQRNNLKTAG